MRVFFSLLFPRTAIEYSLINSLVTLQLSVAQLVSFVATAACPMLLRLNYIRLAHAFIQLFGYDKRRGLTRNAF